MEEWLDYGKNVLLIRWNPVFEYLPLESQIKKYQEEYYFMENQEQVKH